jgi:RNA polymerase subunit RPABC4/transcription elongation factor Spt4
MCGSSKAPCLRESDPKDLFDSQAEFSQIGWVNLTQTTCPSCKKLDDGNGRFCIHCGSILKPVYCSHCGTLNPEDLEQCLECGNSIPKLTDVKWNPVVTVIQPTSAMTDGGTNAIFSNLEGLRTNEEPSGENTSPRPRARLNRKEHASD